MPRKAVLSAAQQVALTALPTAEHDLRLHYTLSENDLSIIVAPDAWPEYAARDETRRDHALELQSVFGYRPFTIAEYRRLARNTYETWKTDDVMPR